MPIILAIESSCDDTSAAIIQDGKILSNFVAGQEVHKDYGGVIPELASRKHLRNIVSVVNIALDMANKRIEDLDAVGITRGPGLLGSLIVGVTFAKGIALSQDIPIVEVNHMEAHILAHFIDDPMPSFPFISLTVSGGHTQLVKVLGVNQFQILGETIDDAAGETFDKCGKFLGLSYPAGPIIDKLAKQGSPIYTFPKPKVGKHQFSFSGLKTSILYFLQKEMKSNSDFIKNNIKDICSSIQSTIVEILIEKLKSAALEHNISTIAIGGGVSANSHLREKVKQLALSQKWTYHIPDFQYCTDNAAMIAISAHYKYLEKRFAGHDMTPNARLKI